MKSGTVESRMSGFIGTPAISCDSSVSCPRPNELTEPLSDTALLDDLIHLQQHRPGIVNPSALAVLRLTTSSNLVGCSTGRSAGLAPFKILSTKVAARR